MQMDPMQLEDEQYLIGEALYDEWILTGSGSQ
jgi:hypothetical protein